MLYALSNSVMMAVARGKALRVAGEVFADRGYTDEGTLAPRGQPGAMIEDAAQSVRQVLGMLEGGYVTSLSGKRVPVSPDTLCLHGDQPDAVQFAKVIREALKEKHIEVRNP
jgi:UPF0271 protein